MNNSAETDRIALRPLTKEDRQHSADEAIQAASARFGGEAHCFGVTEKTSGRLIGYVTAKAGDLSFYITPAERDQGYASEALTLCFDLLFGCDGVKKLSAFCDEQNRYAVKTLYRVGMEKVETKDGGFSALLTAAMWELL
jgi:RimJ/RimL family protein N-acetyltransferase